VGTSSNKFLSFSRKERQFEICGHLQKRTESLKSFKGTKKLVSSFRKYSGLEKLNAPKLLKPLRISSFFLRKKRRNPKQHKQKLTSIEMKKNTTFQKKKIFSSRRNWQRKNSYSFQLFKADFLILCKN